MTNPSLRAWLLAAACASFPSLAAAQLDPASPLAQRDPSQPAPLPFFDARLDEQGLPLEAVGAAVARARVGSTFAEREAARARLVDAVAGLRVDEHELFGTPAWVASTSRLLTEPVAGGAFDPRGVVRTFVGRNAALFEVDGDELDAARLSRNYVTRHNGVRHMTFRQEIGGIELFGCELRANLTRAGELVNVSSSMLPRPAGGFRVAAVAVDPRDALYLAAADIGAVVTTAPVPATEPAGPSRRQTWAPTPDFRADVEITTELVYFPRTREDVRPAWSLVLPEKGLGNTYEMIVDATDGRVLRRWNRLHFLGGTQPVSMRVYTADSPAPLSPGLPTPNGTQASFVPRTLVTVQPGDVGAFSPDHWIDDNVNETLGNNVDAHADANGDNQPDLPRPTGNPFRVFDFALDTNLAPSTYRPAAVTQLFYLCNRFHDRLYELGFDEAAGNFQDDNFGLGGTGGDRLQADAQDNVNGGSQNNANFGTSGSDGSSARMQMYVFTGPAPDRDGDLDADIVYHEFGHGLSIRLHGGLSGTQPQGMGEGWSDFWGTTLLAEPGDDPHGTYHTGGYSTFLLGGLTDNYYFGIRRFPYSTDFNKNPQTYADIDVGQQSYPAGVPRSPVIGNTANEVHNVGEVWCGALLEARAELWALHGFGANDLIQQLVVDGMKLSAGNPTFLQARDAILQADLVASGGANLGALWSAFARRGMGFSASSPGSSTSSGVVEAFDLPSLVIFTYPNGRPTQLQPLTTTTFPVVIQGLAAVQPLSGSGELHYSIGGGPTTTVPMTETAPNEYDVTLPGIACFDEIAWYVTTATSAGNESDPQGAPAASYAATAFSGVIVLASDDLESVGGWSPGFVGDNATTGVWEHGNPIGTAAQPEDDHTAGGSACFFTGQGSSGGAVGDDDVDGGRTTLVSPVYDLSGSAHARIGYWRWYSNGAGSAPGSDVFRVDVSNDGGLSWSNAETVGPSGEATNGGWFFHEFEVADFVPPTAQVRVRFVAEDAGTGSIVEAAIDDFQIEDLECSNVGVPFCFGDGSTATACPCGNFGAGGRGCENSAATGGGMLATSGSTTLDTVVLSASDELATATTIFLQGNAVAPSGLVFGDGVRCVAGSLKRIGVKIAINGSASYPQPGDPSIQTQSAALGDTILPGTTRWYQAYYRDANLAFCAAPPGNSWNVTNGVSLVW